MQENVNHNENKCQIIIDNSRTNDKFIKIIDDDFENVFIYWAVNTS
jgi:hypothetical protein